MGLLHDGARWGRTGSTTCSGSTTTRGIRCTSPGNEFETAFQDYYRFLDREVGSLLEVLPEDAITIVMSDHGARPMMGGLCFNDWLMQEGYLAMTETRHRPDADQGRADRLEPHDRVGRRRLLRALLPEREGPRAAGRRSSPSQYEAVRDELIAKLEAAPGPDGEPLGTKVLKPQDVYPEVRGVAPDLIVYFGDLEWRSMGSVGNPSLYTYENDTGPDGANHDRDGHLRHEGPARVSRMGRVDGMNLVDVGPTILKLYGIEAPEGAVGRSFL